MFTVDFGRMYEDIYGDFDYNREIEINPTRTALVVVDMQPALTSSMAGMGKAFSRILKIPIDYFEDRVKTLVLPNTARLLDCFRARQMTIVYVVTWSETEDLSDMPRYQRQIIPYWESVLGEQLYRKWNEGMGIWEEIAPRHGELVCPKRTGSAFASSMLPFCLRNAGIDTVFLTGCNTNGCVFETAAVGKNMGFDFVLVSDATACFAPVLQQQAETWIDRHFGKVVPTEDALALLGAS